MTDNFLSRSIHYIHPRGIKGWTMFFLEFPPAYLRYRKVMKQ